MQLKTEIKKQALLSKDQTEAFIEKRNQVWGQFFRTIVLDKIYDLTFEQMKSLVKLKL